MNKIGKYTVIGILGKGAMGIVYKARDPLINREIAIKTVRFDLISDEVEKEEVMQRFMREAQSAGSLTHPNIITIYDVGREEDLTYIVMQLIEGPSLQKLISSAERLTTPEVINLMVQVCDGLDYAHKFGIVHRDMKPGNILLDKLGKPYICDFGVARIDTSTLTQAGTAVGTPSYMSPEQVMGKKVDKRSDIFSLGCILYEVLTGRRPFEAESITTVIYKIINENPPALKEFKKGLPVGFEHIISKALAKDPNDRYQSCSQLAADLRDLQQLSEKTIAVTMTREQLAAAKKKERRKLAFIFLIALAAVIIIAGGGAFYLYQKTGEPLSLSNLKALISGKKIEKPSPTAKPGAALEEKLNRAKESFDKQDYTEAARLAEEIIAVDAADAEAQELLNKAKSKISEALTARSQPESPKAPATSPETRKAGESPALVPSKTVIPGSVEDKLNRASESFEKRDYAQTVKLSQEILAVDPGNLKAKEYRDRASAKIKEAEMIGKILSDGLASYENGDYEQCLKQMDEILKLDKENKDALKYKAMAEKAVYEAQAQQEIQQIIMRQKDAEESKEFLILINDIGSPALRQEKMEYAKFLFNNYDGIKWSSISKIDCKFKDRNHAEVSFSYMATAVYQKTGQKTRVFEGTKVWTMEKQGGVWKIIKEEKVD